MGFGVSGSYVLVLVATLAAFGAFYGAAWETMERINDAEAAQTERFTNIQRTLVHVDSLRVQNAATCDVEINATNTGERTLDVGETDLLVDNDYTTGWRDAATVDGADTDVWHPGDRLTIELDGLGQAPDRVKLVTGVGVADGMEVTASC